ncbi:unconventional myosin IC-like [Gigantopelta aegis]|uniref:unconventional myosin IC-like n=1 Tax=Gigantopelta aegis TaxID=1735272 RepID=UPI001B88B09E|nr:unconventional myosin IC-like [Gigantopelta aegis]
MMAQAIDDFTVLPNPTFDEILGILGHRFRQDTIYTFIGDILVSVNPNKELPIYGPQVGRDYVSALQPGHNDLPPHVFYVVNSIVTSLLRHQTPQCVLLTGESGAGKTEAVKMLVSQMLRETEAKKTCQGRNDSSSTAKNILEVSFFSCT